MRDYLRIPESKMRVATLGVNVSDLVIKTRIPDPRSPISGPLTIGFFARIAPEKGLHNLADAYRILRTEKGLPPSRLLAAGYLAPEHKPYLEKISENLRVAGLGDEFSYRGAVDRATKVRFFHEIDVLSVPSGYHEPKGLYLLEAMACGVPAVQPNHGAFPEIIGRTGGGVLAKSESGADVAEVIFELWKDPARAAALGRAGAEGVRRHYTVQHMAAGVLKVYQDAQREPSVEALSHARR
jgi:glycosyltransferase involved in cell wall biosynthesis